MKRLCYTMYISDEGGSKMKKLKEILLTILILLASIAITVVTLLMCVLILMYPLILVIPLMLGSLAAVVIFAYDAACNIISQREDKK